MSQVVMVGTANLASSLKSKFLMTSTSCQKMRRKRERADAKVVNGTPSSDRLGGLLPPAFLEKPKVHGRDVAVVEVDDVLFHVNPEREEFRLQALQAPALEPKHQRRRGLVEVDLFEKKGVREGLLEMALR
jgi:hypothetical protein